MITEVIEQTIIDSSSNIVQEVIIQEETISELGQIGHGLPAGGLTDEVATKGSDNDYDIVWKPLSGLGGGIPDAPNNANAYVRKGLAWVIGYTKDAIDSLINNFQTASQVQTIADAKVSNEAYDSITWNGVTGVAPSKGKLRDKFEQVDSNINSKQSQATFDLTQPTIALISDNGEIVFADTNDFPTPSELTNVKGVTAPLQGQIDLKLDAADYVQHFKGVFISETALNTALPTASAGDYAQVNEVGATDVVNYSWDVEESGWKQVGGTGGATNTDTLPEGSTNLYFTTARVLATVLTGISFLTGGAIVSTDTVLVAFGKLQKQITDLLGTVSKYPSTATNGKILQGNGTNYVEVDPPTASTQGAYTVLANNTASTALPTEQVFKSVAEQAYTGTITWGTTAPTVILNNTHEWQQIGKEVNGRISLSYTNAQTNQQVTIALPPDWPTPKNITGFTSASEIIAFGSGMMFLDRATLPASAGRYCLLRRNSANNGYEIVVTHGSAISVRNVQLTIQYFT
jgi:hypothetical protein